MTVDPLTPLLPPDGTAWFGLYSAPNPGVWTNPTNRDRTDWFAARERLCRPGLTSANTVRTVDIGHQFYAWGDDLRGIDPSGIGLTQWHHDGGRIPMISWMPTTATMEDIRSGVHDDLIRRRATELRDLGFPVMLRFAHEMNGDWYPWNPWYKSNGAYVAPSTSRTELFRWRETWRRVWRLFRNPPTAKPAGVGANNVVFVWCPNGESVPNVPGNQVWDYYPGDGFVDWIGLDLYCRGAESWQQRWGGVLDSTQVPFVRDPTSSTSNYAATKPVVICEMSQSGPDDPGSRATCLREMFCDLTARPYVRGVVWFDQNKGDGNWAVDSAPDWGESVLRLQGFANHPQFNPHVHV